jgi:hypothetical protein
MTPNQQQPIESAASETAEFELPPVERPARESEITRGRPSWDPEEGDFG